MKTVKEVSELTGISVRTLHWYDEIGLLKPTTTSQAGYRLYDDRALETLQQILFFREFDMPLKDIKSKMEAPNFDKEAILRSQKRMLEIKKGRLERLISSIEDILKGENKMDFTVFDKSEIEDIYSSMETNMSEEQKQIFAEQYGSMEEFHKHFIESASSEQAQQNFQKVVEWYGDKESALEAEKNPIIPEVVPAYQKRLQEVLHKLAEKKGQDVTSFEVKALVGEYDFVSKQLYQMKDVKALMLELVASYKTNVKVQAFLDNVYGEGTTEFIGNAIEEFYK